MDRFIRSVDEPKRTYPRAVKQLSPVTYCQTARRFIAMMAASDSETVWFGADAEGTRLWDGHIDELAMFDKALGDNEIAGLHQAALAQMARPR